MSDKNLETLKAEKKGVNDDCDAQIFALNQNQDRSQKIMSGLKYVALAGTIAAGTLGYVFWASSEVDKAMQPQWNTHDKSCNVYVNRAKDCSQKTDALIAESMRKKSDAMRPAFIVGGLGVLGSLGLAFWSSGGFRSRREFVENFELDRTAFKERGQPFRDGNKGGVQVIESNPKNNPRNDI